MKKEIILFGVGEFAQVAFRYFQSDSEYKVVAFAVDNEFCKEPKVMGLPVVAFETVEKHYSPAQYGMFVAIGYNQVNRLRQAKCDQAKTKGYELISYVHPKAISYAERIGDNCFIFEANVIQPFVKIGNNVILWSGNHIGHHTTIGDHCFVASHVVISGNVNVGNNCFIGVNATIRDGITIGPECIIGAGALLVKDAVTRGVYIGNPATLSKVPSNKLKHI